VIFGVGSHSGSSEASFMSVCRSFVLRPYKMWEDGPEFFLTKVHEVYLKWLFMW
jgi:hypothetical protein